MPNCWISSVPLSSLIQPEVPVLLKQTYPGTALTSQSPNRLRLSLDFIRADLHPKTPSPGPPSPDSEPPLGQSRCSSSTQSEASTAVLEELRVCGLGPEGGSRTPSPTLSAMSAVTVNMGLYSPPASTAHVTIHRQTLCHVCYLLLLSVFIRIPTVPLFLKGPYSTFFVYCFKSLGSGRLIFLKKQYFHSATTQGNWSKLTVKTNDFYFKNAFLLIIKEFWKKNQFP